MVVTKRVIWPRTPAVCFFCVVSRGVWGRNQGNRDVYAEWVSIRKVFKGVQRSGTAGDMCRGVFVLSIEQGYVSRSAGQAAKEESSSGIEDSWRLRIKGETFFQGFS